MESASSPAEQGESNPLAEARPGSARSWPFLVVTGIGVCLFMIRLAAPPNLLDQDQERPAAYVLDAVMNGHWLCQTDIHGNITSKPPLYTWLSALATLACGRISLFTLYLPGALAALGTALLILAVGRRYFGTRAALIAAIAVMLCSAGLKEFGLARTDGVFAFAVTATALLGFRAWNTGGGWSWFWLAAAAATLTKGPLGVVLAACGLLASYWESKSGHLSRLRGSHLLGFVLFFAVSGGWFLLAYGEMGKPLVDKMIGQELVGHAVSEGRRYFPGMLIWQQPLYYLGRAAPWSLLAYYGLWRVWKYPAASTPVRRFERFLFCWFGVGLFIFSMAPHQRADLLWPLLPAGALIAGRELGRLVERTRDPKFYVGFAAAVAAGIGGFTFYYFVPHARMPIIQHTVALKALAAQINQHVGAEFPITHVDDRMTLQVYLNTRRPLISHKRAAELLRGQQTVCLAVDDLAELRAARRPDDPPFYTLLPASGALSHCPTRIISNRSRLKPEEPAAFCFGSLYFRIAGAQMLSATEKGFRFAPSAGDAKVTVVNEGDEPSRVKLCSVHSGAAFTQERVLASRQKWEASLGPPTRP